MREWGSLGEAVAEERRGEIITQHTRMRTFSAVASSSNEDEELFYGLMDLVGAIRGALFYLR